MGAGKSRMTGYLDNSGAGVIASPMPMSNWRWILTGPRNAKSVILVPPYCASSRI